MRKSCETSLRENAQTLKLKVKRERDGTWYCFETAKGNWDVYITVFDAKDGVSYFYWDMVPKGVQMTAVRLRDLALKTCRYSFKNWDELKGILNRYKEGNSNA